MGQDLGRNARVFDETTMNSAGTAVQLQRGTARLTEREKQNLTQVFHKLAALSPRDEFIDRTTFEHYFPLGGILGGRLFASFDKNKNGVIDLQEFLDGMLTCLKGSSDEKSQVAFEMFNLDDSEGVSATELLIVLKSVLQTTARQANGGHTLPLTGFLTKDKGELDAAAHQIVQELFNDKKADLDKDNKLTVSVFKSWMESHPFVLDSIFGQACLKDKKIQYIRLDDELRKPVGKSPTDVRKQTWVKPVEVEQEPPFTGDYKTAEYLWSPVFSQTPKKPCSRSKLAACLVFDSLYMYGGRGTCSSLKDLWRYDIGENAWYPVHSEEEDNKPPSLQDHTMSVYKGKLVVFGGEFTSSTETPLWMFDVASSTWSRPSPKAGQKGPVNRKGHTTVLCGDCMYVFGGYIDLRGATDELWKYDFVSNTWTRERSKSRDWPSPRYSNSAAVFDKSMVVFGGLEEQQCKNDLWLWNIAAKKWTRIKSRGAPPPMFGHTAVKVGEGMLVFGGESSGGTLHNDIWRFDFESRSWSKISTLGMIAPPARSHHTIVPIPDFLISTLRPTSSHSAPPCTPAPDREHPRAERDTQSKPSQKSKQSLGKLIVCPDSSENGTSPAQSSASLNSSVLLVNIGDDRPSQPISGSLDSLVSKLDATKNEHMSMVNHGGEFSPSTSLNQEQLTKQLNSYNKSAENIVYDPGSVNENEPTKTTSESTLNSSSCCTIDATRHTVDRSSYPRYNPTGSYSREGSLGLLPPSQKLLKPMSAELLGRDHVTRRLFPPEVKNTGIVYLMLLGGMSKHVENYGKSIDMWRCEIDPAKRKSRNIRQIVVQSTQAPLQATSQGVSGEYCRLEGADDSTDESGDDDDDDVNDVVNECVLMDVTDSDNTSMELPLINGEIRSGTTPISEDMSRVSVN